MRLGLDLARKLVEYASMDARDENAHGKDLPLSPLRQDRSRRAAWVIGLLTVAAITALAFSAYRQPELLLNLMGLRYCG